MTIPAPTTTATEEELPREVLQDILSLVMATPPSLETLSTWSEAEAQAAADWAGAVHVHASDHDDVEVPEMPVCLAPWMDSSTTTATKRTVAKPTLPSLPAPGTVVQLALAGGAVSAWRVASVGERTIFLVPVTDEADYSEADLDCGEAPRLLWLDLDAFQADLRGSL